jgi:tetratricopeptide (TPR) repeat protein
VLLNYTYDQSAAMYHREWGDYFRIKGKYRDAAKAYKKSLAIYEKDSFVHKNLSFVYEKTGDMASAARHAKRAAALDPKKYAQDGKRGSYNEELQKGAKARQDGRWADCIRHFQNALNSGEKIAQAHVRVIQSYINSCKKRLGQ